MNNTNTPTATPWKLNMTFAELRECIKRMIKEDPREYSRLRRIAIQQGWPGNHPLKSMKIRLLQRLIINNP